MSGSARNKRGTLTHAAVVREALALVDELGPDALTYRRLAERLRVGTMTLYTYAHSREDLVKGVVALLLAETDNGVVAGEAWGETITRVVRSMRAMALRHPRAYPLLMGLSHVEPPISDYTLAVLRLHEPYGAAPALPPGSLSIVIAYTEGFLGRMTTALLDDGDAAGTKPTGLALLDPGLAAELTELVDGELFERGLSVILEGLRARDAGGR